MKSEKIKNNNVGWCEYENGGIVKLGLIRYPKEPYAIFQLPVRKSKKYFQVWTGDKWCKLNIKKII